MAYVVVQGLCKIFQYGTCRNFSVAQMINAESLEVTNLEMAVKFFLGTLL